MSLVPRRARLALLPLALVLTGCGGISEQTQQWYDPADGVSADAASLELRNVLAVTASDADPASVLATLVNRGADDDALLALSVDGQPVTLPAPIELPADSVTTIGPDRDDSVVLPPGQRPGSVVEVEMSFGVAPATTLEIQVVGPNGGYADLPLPEPSDLDG